MRSWLESVVKLRSYACRSWPAPGLKTLAKAPRQGSQFYDQGGKIFRALGARTLTTKTMAWWVRHSCCLEQMLSANHCLAPCYFRMRKWMDNCEWWGAIKIAMNLLSTIWMSSLVTTEGAGPAIDWTMWHCLLLARPVRRSGTVQDC